MKAMRFVSAICYVLVSTLSALAAPAIPTNGLTLWLKADAGVTTNASSMVTAWQDQSTRSNDLSQGYGPYQPKLTNNALNGQPVIQFRDQFLSRAAVPGTNLFSNTAATIFLVQKQLGSDGRTTTLSWRTGNEQRFMVHATYDDSIALQIGHPSYGGDLGAPQPPNWDDNWHVLTLRRAGTNADIRVDGAGLIDPRVTYFTADGDNTQTTDLYLANDIWWNTFNGDIAEVIVYNTALSDTDRNSVESYLRSKWGLATAPAAAPDLLIKNSAEPDAAFTANNVYQFTPDGSQTRTQAVATLGTAVFNVKVENDGIWTKPVVLRATESVASGWSIAYRLGASNITPAIVSPAGFSTTNLPLGTSLMINVEVTMSGIVAPGTNKTVTISAYDDYVTNIVRDAVQAMAVAAPGVQPDLLVRRPIDPGPIGDNIYNTTGAGQTAWQEVFTNQTASYLVTLANDGNTNMSVNLSFTPTGSPWLVSGGIRELQFDGSDDYVDLGAWTAGTNWTLEAWVRPTSTPNGRRIIAGGGAECRDWGIAMHDGQFALETRQPGGCTIAYRTGVAVTASNWYHLSATCDGSNATLYVHGPLLSGGQLDVNNPLVVTGAVDFNYVGTAAGTRIGGNYCCGGENFPGAIRDVRIWNTALSSNAIRTGILYPRDGSEAGLLGLWLLDEGTGTRAFDLSPNRRNGTLVNGPNWQPFTWPYAGPATNYLVVPGGYKELAIAVLPPTGTAAGASTDLLVSANASGRQDAVRLVTTAIHPSATPVSPLFTTSADFGKGRFIGTDNFTVPDQLQLSTNSSALPFLWVPNSDDGTVSKVETLTGRELGRYRVCPPGVTGNPSRTTVDLRGSCWVANRNTATVVKIGLLENGDTLDRNGDGVIQTSRDLNGDGTITSDEMLPWGQDECVLHEVFLLPGNETNRVPGTYLGSYQNNYWNPGPRGLGVDAQGNLWCGTHDTMKYYYLSGISGQILRTIDVAPSNHTAYGAVIDAQGILWSSGYKEGGQQNILRLNPADGAFRTIALDFHSYGIGLDRNNHLFVTGHQEARLTRWNVLTGTMDWSVTVGGNNRGVAVTDDGDVWMASSSQGAVYRYSNEGVQKSVIPIGPSPTGVSVDAAGKVWVVGTGDQYIRRIDPATDTVDLTKLISGSGHYGYSDMTGILARNSTVRLGLWTAVHDSQMTNTAWMRVNWTGTDITGTNILVRVRSSNNRATWSGWESAANGAPLLSTPPGRFIEFEVTLRGLPGIAAPTLQDIAAAGLAPAEADLAISLRASPNPVLSEHLTTCFLTVTNLSTNWAAGVWFTNLLPAGLDVLNVTVPGGSYLRTNNLVVCQMGGVGPRAATTITMVVEPQFAGSMTNAASVTATGADPNLGNNTNSLVLQVTPVICVTPLTGIVGWWPGESNALSLAWTNHGTATVSTTFAPGKSGNAFTFDQNEDQIRIPHAPELNINRSGFTAQFWMKGGKNQPAQGDNLVALMEKSHGWVDSTGWAIQVFPASGVMSFGVGVGSGGNRFVGADSTVNVLDDRWHHIAATWDGSNLRLFVDAVLQATTPLTMVANNERPLNFGFAWGNGYPQRFFRGQLDEVMIHNRALNTAEITAVYEARSAGLCRGTPFIVLPDRFADMAVNRSFAQMAAAAGGQPPYTFTYIPGTQPPGLLLSPSGLLSGVPNQPGVYSFTLNATDATSALGQRMFTNKVYACTTPPSGLVGWWQAENNPDDTAGTSHAILYSGATYEPGKVGSAFAFDGVDDLIMLQNSRVGAVDITTNSVSVDAWVWLAATNPPTRGVQFIYDKHWTWSPDGCILYLQDGIPYFNIVTTTDSTFAISNTAAIPQRQWVHLAATYDGATVRLYVNGVETAAAPLTGNITHNDRDAAIGNDNGGDRSYGFNGLIDEVEVFNRALTPAEIQAIVQAGAAGKCVPTPADLMVKNAGEPDANYALNNVYEPGPSAAQTKSQSVLPLGTGTYSVRFDNDGAEARSFALKAVESTNLYWAVTYLQGASDVTAQMLSATGLAVNNLGPGASLLLTVSMSPGIPVPGNTTKSVVINAYFDSAAATVRDAIQMVTTVQPTYQPDMQIRRDIDPGYIGAGIYNTTGVDQTKTYEVEPGISASYLVMLRNNGNVPTRYRLGSTTPAAGWNVGLCGDRVVVGWDNADDYVEVTNSPALHSGRQLTVSGWFKTAGFTKQWQNVFWKGNFPDCTGGCENREYSMWLNSAGYLWLSSTPSNRVGVGELVLGTPSGIIQAGRWYHFAAVFNCDSNVQRIYVDGQLRAEGPYNTSGIRSSDGPLKIGQGGGTGETFNGSIRELAIWDRERTTNEIAQEISAGLIGAEPGLRGYWPLNDGMGDARDFSPYANHGSLRNGASWKLDKATAGSCFDITAAATSGGFTNIVIPAGGEYEAVLNVTPGFSVTPGTTLELALTGSSLVDPSRADTVKARTYVLPPSVNPVGGTFTTREDFDLGRGIGVDSQSVSGQLQLSTNATTLPFLWVPNNEGTLSKVDSRTGRELARYRTCPPNVNGQPSRTTVDLLGNCWVVNRYAGTVIKVGLLENGVYIDRNGNGQADTSRDLNNDGDITGAELLPWGQDECVLFEVMLSPGTENTYVPGTYTGSYYNDWGYPGPRGVAVDSEGNCWVGTLETKRFYYLDGTTGAILRNIDLSPINHRSYGAVLDRNGILWASSHDRNWVLRLDPATGTYTNILLGHFSYGINADRNNHVFVSGWQNSRLSRINALTGAIEWSVPGVYESRGIAITDDGDVWVANSGPGTVARWSNDGALKAQIPAGNQPTGVAVDAAGKVWVLGLGDPTLRRIDPAYNTVDLTKDLQCGNNGGFHYGYSDMTGTVSRNATTRIGTWSVVHNSRVLNTPWGIVSWLADTPAGTSLKVRVRSSNNRTVWSTWENVYNGTPLHSTPPGKYLEVEVTFQSTDPAVTPALQELRIQPAVSASYGTLIYSNSFETVIGPEWSTNSVGVTPAGGRHFLGQFGNQTVTLTFSNLAPHAAVTVMADVYAIRTWDGNDTSDGPDLFELNVAGGLKLVHSTFNNGPSNSIAAGQAYPDQHPAGVNPARTGAAETNSLGFTVPGVGLMDSVYRLTYSLPHSSDWLMLNFLASGLNTNLTEESWGLDNVQVFLTPREGPPRLLPINYEPSGFTIELRGEPGWNYVIQGSPDLVNWSGLVTNRISTNVIQFIDPNPGSRSQRFYRALQLP